MKKVNIDFVPRPIRRWAPPLIGIPLMLAWAAWGGDAMRFIFFTHHLFWAAALGLLIGPLLETFVSGPNIGKGKLSARKTNGAARRAKTHIGPATRNPMAIAASTVAVDERLAALRKQKAAVERNIARISKDRGHAS